MPILIGRPQVVESRAERYGLKIRPGRDFEIVNPEDDPRYRDYVDDYFALVGRKGITPEAARTAVRTNTTVIGALAVRRGEADALICGLEGRFDRHLRDIRQIIGQAERRARLLRAQPADLRAAAPCSSPTPIVCLDPTAEEIAEMTRLAADHIRRFGITPKAALLSHSNFGSHRLRQRRARCAPRSTSCASKQPELEVDGEMHGDMALSEELRRRFMPTSRLSGEANLLVFPTLDAANIALNLLKVMTDALHVGPILLGSAMPAHILTPSVTSRGVVNMTALAVVEAQVRARAAA